MSGTDEYPTIAAVATPPGRGGIAVLRISGPDALAVLGRLFAPARRRTGDASTRGKAVVLSAFDAAGDLSKRSRTGDLSAAGRTNDPLKQGGADVPSTVRRDAGFVFQPRRMHYGRALGSRGETLDEALAVYMPGPASATGEDVGELHCHAGQGICAALLEAAGAAGAAPAGPGDFTRRAFLNGRLDLTQAEAVAELCDARTGAGARLAAAKLDGTLGRETGLLRDALDDLRLQCVLDADFPEEEAEHLGEAAFRQRLDNCASSLRRLLSAYERARFWREGASAVLAGRVNVGKSSLLNALLGRERAIVSDVPGTTRDYLEESLNLGGLEVRLTDTAGLRAGGGSVEAEGMRRAGALAEQADLVIFVKDVRNPVNPKAAEGSASWASLRLYPEEMDFLRLHRDRCRNGGLIAVLNKIDTLPDPEAARKALEAFSVALSDVARECQSDDEEGRGKNLFGKAAGTQPAPAGERPVPVCAAVSALRGDGLEDLAAAVRAALTAQGGINPGDTVPNLRQSTLMRAALDELTSLERERADGYPRDMLALRLERAARMLDEVSGASGNSELLDRIFSAFCIGK
ncbi:MAG: tRNA modification GTPase [Desulfovibrio sp.]|jgi:tRNA modification GTPase|nr:tRNA modification GTPase [Desulfovibrio sp.]